MRIPEQVKVIGVGNMRYSHLASGRSLQDRPKKWARGAIRRRDSDKAHRFQENGLARQRIKPPLISQNWDDMLRVAGALKMGTVRASEFIRSLRRGGRQSLLGRALGELGRIPKTLHLLNFVDDESS